MQQHRSCLLNDVSDAPLNFAILMMSSNTTEADGLSLLCNMFLEESVSKSAIVCMVMLHSYIMLCSKAFKGFLGFHSLG